MNTTPTPVFAHESSVVARSAGSTVWTVRGITRAAVQDVGTGWIASTGGHYTDRAAAERAVTAALTR